MPGYPILSQSGDLLIGGVGGVETRLPGNPTTTRQFLLSVGTGSAANAPSWAAIGLSDITDVSQNGFVKGNSGGTGLEQSSRLIDNGTSVVVASASSTNPFVVRNGTAGTQELQIYHDGTDGWIAPQNNGKLRWGTGGYYDPANNTLSLDSTGSMRLVRTGSSIDGYVGGVARVRLQSSQLVISNSAGFAWGSGGNATTAVDTKLLRASAGIVQVADGSNNDATLQAALLIASGSKIRIGTAATPTVAGTVGDIQWDNDNIYVYTSDGWKKAALTAVE